MTAKGFFMLSLLNITKNYFANVYTSVFKLNVKQQYCLCESRANLNIGINQY